MQIRTLAMAALAATSLAQPVAAADLADGSYSFKVIRDGDQVGIQTITAHHDGQDLILDISVAIKVKVAFITAYRYEQTRREVWRDGHLVAFESDTNDDGTKAKTSGKLDGAMLVVNGPGGKQTLRSDILSNSWWNPEIVKQAELLNTIDNKILKVSIADKGEEMVETAAGKVAAHHYVVSGDIDREAWYDKSGRWVHMRLIGGGKPADWVLQ